MSEATKADRPLPVLSSEGLGPNARVQACRPEDRALLATAAGAELVACATAAMKEEGDPEMAAFVAWAVKIYRQHAYRHTSATSGQWAAWQAGRAQQAEQLMHLRGVCRSMGLWMAEALAVMDTVDPDDTTEAEALTTLTRRGEMLVLAALAQGGPLGPNVRANLPP